MEAIGGSSPFGFKMGYRLLVGMTLASTGVSFSAPQSISVTQPSATVRVAEGNDYATYMLGNRWDMDCPDWSGIAGHPPDSVWDERFTCDVSQTSSNQIAAEAFSGGVYQGTAVNGNPWFWLAYPGRFSTIRLAKGALFPIDTSKYRHFTAKVRYTGSAITQSFNLNFFSDHEGTTFGGTRFAQPRPVPGAWTIVTYDLWDLASYFSPSDVKWTDFPVVRGLRVNPTFEQGVSFEFDWIRLTADPGLPGSPDSTTLVTWNASGTGTDSFSIEAIDTAGVVFALVTDLPAGTTSHRADFSRLPPGAYSVRVRASIGTLGTAAGQVLVNEAPLLHFTEPDKQGDIEHAYSKVEACTKPGDPSSCYDWSDFDQNDIYILTNSVVSNSLPQQPPVEIQNNAVCGAEPVCPDPACVGDPYFYLTTCLQRDPNIPPQFPDNCFANRFALIDTDKYRMLTYKFEVVGTLGCGNITRIIWGNSLLTPTVGDDIDVQEGLNTYVVGDMDDLWLATSVNQGSTGHWNGLLKYFRFDPHELWDARTVRVHSLSLAPVDAADLAGQFEIQWLDSDADDDASINVYYDLDRLPGNGNETRVVSGISEDVADSYEWNTAAPVEVAPGEYHIYSEISDSLNTTVRYATGPLRIPGLRAQTRTGAGVSLSWTDFAGVETEYRVQRRLLGTAVFQDLAILAANSTSFRDLTVVAGVSYEYQVVACTVSGCTSQSLRIGPVIARALELFGSGSEESTGPQSGASQGH